MYCFRPQPRKKEKIAKKNDAKFTGLIIPNVFGPFGNPYYNSVISTFCYQLTHNKQPEIDIDSVLKLIYIGELVNVIKDQIKPKSDMDKDPIICIIHVNHTVLIKVTDLLEKLLIFKYNYFEHGIIPDLSQKFDRDLFNTFICYIDHKSFYPFNLSKNSDNRGSFIEIARLTSGGQVSFSTTMPGVVRGNHFHTRKAERFAVIKGKAVIEIRRIGTNEVFSFNMDGEKPSFVDIPIWYSHNIKNTSNEELYTIFWTNEFFNPEDTDTYFEKVNNDL